MLTNRSLKRSSRNWHNDEGDLSVDTPYPPTLSIHPINTSYQSTLSPLHTVSYYTSLTNEVPLTHSIHPPYAHTYYAHTHTMHTFNQSTPCTYYYEHTMDQQSTGSILGVSFESFLDSEDIQNLLAEDAGILEDITEIWMVRKLSPYRWSTFTETILSKHD